MPIKSVLQRFQPAPLYIILVLSICYFSFQLVLSHITHALTLLISSYHMLCNIFALAGCIVTLKQSTQKSDHDHGSIGNFGKCSDGTQNGQNVCGPMPIDGADNTKAVVLNFDNCSKGMGFCGGGGGGGSGDRSDNGNGDSGCKSVKKILSKCEQRELKLRNTFGWARIDILAMLIVCIILASLSFSLLVEALQTLVHIDHQDTMHLPIPVMLLGFVGLLLNGLTYLLIGGYTMHQGSFLHMTPGGNVILDRAMSNSADLAFKPEERQLSSAKMAREQRAQDQQLKQQLQTEGIETIAAKKSAKSAKCGIRRQGAAEMLRDVSSTIFVIVCGFIVYMAEDEQHTAKFIDPVLSIFSCVLLVSLSYRYMKESCLVLLQTIPDSIDMQNFEGTLVKRFPQIVSFHDLHIWQLTPQKCIATVHVQFQSPKLYLMAIEEVRSYFHDNGITEVTIQPEFYSGKTPSVSSASITPSIECLMQCSAPECADKVCCKDSRTDLREVISTSPSPGNTTFESSIKMSKINKQKTIASCGSLQINKSTNSKTHFIKKLLPRIEIGHNFERSKSTNDLTKHKQQQHQHEQQNPKTAQRVQTLKKTVSESNVEQSSFVDMLQNRIHSSVRQSEADAKVAAAGAATSAGIDQAKNEPQIKT